MSLYNNLVVKFLSIRCPWCCGSSLSYTRCRRHFWFRWKEHVQSAGCIEDGTKKPFIRLVHKVFQLKSANQFALASPFKRQCDIQLVEYRTGCEAPPRRRRTRQPWHHNYCPEDRLQSANTSIAIESHHHCHSRLCSSVSHCRADWSMLWDQLKNAQHAPSF